MRENSSMRAWSPTSNNPRSSPQPKQAHSQSLTPQLLLQIRCQQSMKQLFSRFPPHRQPPRPIGSRPQPALHRLANPQVFILHSIPNLDALLVVGACTLAHITEIEIENHPAMVNVNRHH